MFKKNVATVLTVAMFCGISGTVMASDVESDYVVTYSAEAITDMDDLIALALTQSNEKGRSAIASDELKVEQLLEVRQYENGVTEKDYAGTVITRSQKAAGDIPGSWSVSNSGYGVYVNNTAYYTRRTGGSLGDTTCRIDRITFNISANSTTFATSVQAFLMYNSTWLNGYCSGTSSENVTVYTNDSVFHAGSEFPIQCSVNLNNGNHITTYLYVHPDGI